MTVKKPLCIYSGKLKELQIGDSLGAFANYDRGTATLSNEQFLFQYRYFKLSGSEQFTMAGNARMVLTDLNANDSVILGSPKIPQSNFTIPDNYQLDTIARLSLINANRATLQGTSNLVITDDFKTRSRIVLAGTG